MERLDKIGNIINQSDEQKLQWGYLLSLIHEYLSNGFNSQITVDIQKGRISNIKRSDWTSGLTQTSYYLDKME